MEENMTDEEIKTALLETLDSALESINQNCCNPKVISIDKQNGRCVIELNLVIIEEDGFAGFEGY